MPLDDVRDAGYTVDLAYEAPDELPDIYLIRATMPATADDPVAHEAITYLADDPAVIAAFLESRK